jgi:hypothetical protein
MKDAGLGSPVLAYSIVWRKSEAVTFSSTAIECALGRLRWLMTSIMRWLSLGQ